MIFPARWMLMLLASGLFCAAVPHAQAQADSLQGDIGRIVAADGVIVMHDAGRILGAPLHFHEREWLLTGAVVAATAALFTIDESGRTLAQQNHSHFGDDIFGFGREYGREVYGLSASAGLYLGGLVFEDAGVRETGVMLFESIVFSGAITTVLKSLLGRSRPYTEEGPTKFRTFQFHTETTSLPSGHATVAFAVSSVLAGRLKNVFATIALYAAATITAMSRVYHDAHWISDNFLGAAIGTFVGLSLSEQHDGDSHAVAIRLLPDWRGLRIEIEF